MDLWLLESIRWTDILDIGLMSWILCRGLMIMRGTARDRDHAGLLALMLLYALADFLELITLHTMLNQFKIVVPVAVIVLFQKDIRRALANAGGRLFFSGQSQAAGLSLPIVEELVRASTTMASRRVGAIIAIERAALLGPLRRARHARRRRREPGTAPGHLSTRPAPCTMERSFYKKVGLRRHRSFSPHPVQKRESIFWYPAPRRHRAHRRDRRPRAHGE